LTKKKNQTDTPVLISETEVKQVWDFYQYAVNMANPYMNPAITPQLLNQRMQDITMNPIVPNQDRLTSALADPKNSEIELQGISEHFEIASQPYKRLLSYLGNMLSWDLTMTPLNAEKDDYGTNSYKRDQKAVEKFLDDFDYEKEFEVAVKEMLRNETFFCSQRLDMEVPILQELPASPIYTKITGRWSYGLMFSINMYFFTLPGADLNMFHPFFAKTYGDVWGLNGGRMKPYIPSLPAESRGGSAWVYWQDVPVDVGWAFKMTPEIATRLPYFTGLFSDLILQPIMRNLQRDMNMSAASRILAGEVPMLKDAGAKVSDQIAMSPETLGKFMQLVKSAISSAVKFAAAPLNNMQGISFATDNAMYPTYLKNLLAASGVNTSLIFTSDARPNQLESQLSLNTDEQLMMSLYPQFNAFLKYNVNKLTKKFKWDFEFEGTRFFTNRDERLNRQKELLAYGIVLPQKISAAIGMKPQNFRRQMEEAKANGFVDSLTPIVQAAQQASDGGRPRKSNSELGDAGAQTREDGGNLSKGGKV